MSIVQRRPLYSQVAERLSGQISSGEYPAGRLPSEQSLAREFGVSVVTLRRALVIVEESGLVERRQGSGTYIRDWKPKHISRSRKTGLIDYIPCAGSEYVTGSFFNYLLLSTQAETSKREYNCVLSHPELNSMPLPISRKRVDGIMVAGTYYPHDISRPVPEIWEPVTDELLENNESYMHMLAATGFPIVAVANYTRHPAVTKVNANYALSFAEAIEYLIDNGHRSIAYWGGEKKWPEFAEREKAFRQQMQLHGLPCPDETVATYPSHGAFDNDTAIQAACAVMKSSAKPTAIIAGSGSSDRVIAAASSLGLVIPRDLSLIAVSQCPPGTHTDEPDRSADRSGAAISVLEMPVREMAQAAITRLLELIDGHPFDSNNRETLIQMKLRRRSSVAHCE